MRGKRTRDWALHDRRKFANLPKWAVGFAVGRNGLHVSATEDHLFQPQPDRSQKSPRIDLTSALKRDADKLIDMADELRRAEIDRIYELLIEEPERWDGLS